MRPAEAKQWPPACCQDPPEMPFLLQVHRYMYRSEILSSDLQAFPTEMPEENVRVHKDQGRRILLAVQALPAHMPVQEH